MIYTGASSDEYCDTGSEAPLVNTFTKDLTGTTIEATNVAPVDARRPLEHATVLVLRSEGASGGSHGPVSYSWKFTTIGDPCPLLQNTWLVGASGTGITAGLNEATVIPCLLNGTTGNGPLQEIIVRVQFKTADANAWSDDATGEDGTNGRSSVVRSSCNLQHQCSVCPSGDTIAVNTTDDCAVCAPASTGIPDLRRFLVGANTLDFHQGMGDERDKCDVSKVVTTFDKATYGFYFDGLTTRMANVDSNGGASTTKITLSLWMRGPYKEGVDSGILNLGGSGAGGTQSGFRLVLSSTR
jgi:hypothetical protein